MYGVAVMSFLALVFQGQTVDTFPSNVFQDTCGTHFLDRWTAATSGRCHEELTVLAHGALFDGDWFGKHFRGTTGAGGNGSYTKGQSSQIS